MLTETLAELARVTDGQLLGLDREFSGISTDTRYLRSGNVFVALKGDRFNGHDFAGKAEELGAVGVIASEDVHSGLSRIMVEDTRHALGQYARAWRDQFEIPVIAVTGSNGKTTVKEMLAAILRRCFKTLATRGNQNNEIGVPLTLLGLQADHAAAVVEMGTNHPGEIARLTEIARPTVGVVTNAASAHLEALGSVEGVAREKGALFEGLGDGGVAVINADDTQALLWQHLAGTRRTITFGFNEFADVNVIADSVRMQPDSGCCSFRLRTAAGEVDVVLHIPGHHNIMNALAAAAAASAVGIDIKDIGVGLANVTGVSGRLQLFTTASGVRIVDDTYNANPASLNAALQFATSLGMPAWLVLGDMRELGEAAALLHRQAGKRAKTAGVQRLYAYGEWAHEAAEGFGANATHFNDIDELIERVAGALQPETVVLIKGSRGMRMERVVQALKGGADRAVGNGGS